MATHSSRPSSSRSAGSGDSATSTTLMSACRDTGSRSRTITRAGAGRRFSTRDRPPLDRAAGASRTGPCARSGRPARARPPPGRRPRAPARCPRRARSAAARWCRRTRRRTNVDTGPASSTWPVPLVIVARRCASGLWAGAVTWSSRAGSANTATVVRCGVPSAGHGGRPGQPPGRGHGAVHRLRHHHLHRRRRRDGALPLGRHRQRGVHRRTGGHHDRLRRAAHVDPPRLQLGHRRPRRPGGPWTGSARTPASPRRWPARPSRTRSAPAAPVAPSVRTEAGRRRPRTSRRRAPRSSAPAPARRRRRPRPRSPPPGAAGPSPAAGPARPAPRPARAAPATRRSACPRRLVRDLDQLRRPPRPRPRPTRAVPARPSASAAASSSPLRRASRASSSSRAASAASCPSIAASARSASRTAASAARTRSSGTSARSR